MPLAFHAKHPLQPFTLHLFNFGTFLTLLTSQCSNPSTLQRCNDSTLEPFNALPHPNAPQPHPPLHRRRDLSPDSASGFPPAKFRPARPSRHCPDRVRFGLASGTPNRRVALRNCLLRAFGLAGFSPKSRSGRPLPPLPPVRLGPLPPVWLRPPVRHHRLACRSRANHRQRRRLRSRTSRGRLDQSSHTASPRRTRYQFSDLSTPILATPHRTFSPLRTDSHLLQPLRSTFARSRAGAADRRRSLCPLLSALGNRIEHRGGFANETKTTRARATRRCLRLYYGCRRDMDRLSPAPSSRSPRSQAAARYHCHCPFADRLRLCYPGSQQFSALWRPSHRIPPRPARPGKIRLCRAFLLPRSQRERTTCRVVVVQSHHLSLSPLPTSLLDAPCYLLYATHYPHPLLSAFDVRRSMLGVRCLSLPFQPFNSSTIHN